LPCQFLFLQLGSYKKIPHCIRQCLIIYGTGFPHRPSTFLVVSDKELYVSIAMPVAAAIITFKIINCFKPDCK